jgi:hypothetical protein
MGDGSSRSGRLELMHGIQPYPDEPGRSRDRLTNFTNVGDVVGTGIATVAFDRDQLAITADIVVPGSITRVQQMLNEEPLVTTLGPFTTYDANTSTTKTRGMGYPPYEMVKLLLGADLNARQVYELVVPALAEAGLKKPVPLSLIFSPWPWYPYCESPQSLSLYNIRPTMRHMCPDLSQSPTGTVPRPPPLHHPDPLLALQVTLICWTWLVGFMARSLKTDPTILTAVMFVLALTTLTWSGNGLVKPSPTDCCYYVEWRTTIPHLISTTPCEGGGLYHGVSAHCIIQQSVDADHAAQDVLAFEVTPTHVMAFQNFCFAGAACFEVGTILLPFSITPGDATWTVARAMLEADRGRADAFDLGGDPENGAITPGGVRALRNLSGYFPHIWMEARNQV